MKGKILEEGTYVVVQCPHCKADKILYDTFNPNDSAAIDAFEGKQTYTCEGCNKFFDIEFEEI